LQYRSIIVGIDEMSASDNESATAVVTQTSSNVNKLKPRRNMITTVPIPRQVFVKDAIYNELITDTAI